jgi:type IV pilus assembly protein PilA
LEVNMLSWIRSRLDREEGFTLIELMVVVLIIAILIAIAIPTFLGARQRAQDRAAQSDLRNGLTAAKVYYVDNEEYGTSVTDAAFETSLESIEPSLDFAPMASASQTVVGFVRGDQQVVFTKQSASSTWFCIADDASAGGGTTYDSDAAVANVDTAAECDQSSW